MRNPYFDLKQRYSCIQCSGHIEEKNCIRCSELIHHECSDCGDITNEIKHSCFLNYTPFDQRLG